MQVQLNDEDSSLREYLEAGHGEINMADFVQYSLDMKLLDVQVSPHNCMGPMVTPH